VDRPARLPIAALAFTAAAALSCWNPIAAPFGIIVGIGSFVLGVRAMRSGARRGPSIVAVVVSVMAVIASALVLALTAGVGRELRGTAVVAHPPRGAVAAELDAAAERTRASRERAKRELDGLGGAHPGQPGGPPAKDDRPR
jgi:hypothetical protein